MNNQKKVGIVTLNGYFNFGNRLQNYALTKILEKNGYDVYTLWNKSKKDIVKDWIKSKLFFIKKYNRFRKFYKFSKNNMKELINNTKNLNYLDYFVVGSDQVWNYKLIDKDKTWFEAPKNKITISYSASLGTSTIPNEFGEKLKKQLNNYSAISVREKSAQVLLKEIMPDREIELLIDPTLLLDSQTWEETMKCPTKRIPEKYIFTYFIGEIKEEYYKEITRFSNENDCEIINILDPKCEFYDVGPEEFLYLIKNSFMVCTDSFHACVFSFKFNKPFVIFKRTGVGISNDLYTRLENLLSLFELKNREYNGKKITIENLNCDYSQSLEILNKEINKGTKFLLDNLNNIENTSIKGRKKNE